MTISIFLVIVLVNVLANSPDDYSHTGHSPGERPVNSPDDYSNSSGHCPGERPGE